MKPERTKGAKAQGVAVKAVAVTVRSGPDAGASVEGSAGASISIGSAKDNDLVLTDPTVSRYHLELTPVALGIRMDDLGSRNGTFVGDLIVERLVAPPDVSVRIGANVLHVVDATKEAAPVLRGGVLPGLVAHSAAMSAVVDDVRRVAATTASVLVRGETGTGKEVIARAIHRLSPRANGPFVVVDCGSLPATLVASELFGHQQGAFTGAVRQRQGAFELAHGGTLFLDEIGELPLEVQPVLLGALERRRFRRVGGERTIDVDVRIIAATHRDLRAQVNEERFRGDLYYRLAVARLHIPPLRERPEDIAPLVRHFVEEIGGGIETPFGVDALAALARQRWSGNARELRNVVEAALAMGHLQLDPTEREVALESPDAPLPTYHDARSGALEAFERSYFTELMRRTGGNASAAARLAHMARPYLLRLLKRHKLR